MPKNDITIAEYIFCFISYNRSNTLKAAPTKGIQNARTACNTPDELCITIDGYQQTGYSKLSETWQKRTDRPVCKIAESNTQRRQEIECKKDLKCWATYNHNNAQNNCAVAFNRASRLDQRWARIWNEQKLSHARWLSKKKSSITYFTDKDDIRLECSYSPDFPGKAKINYMNSAGAKSSIKLDD